MESHEYRHTEEGPLSSAAVECSSRKTFRGGRLAALVDPHGACGILRMSQ